MQIRPYQVDDETTVIRLWEQCGLTRSWNDPQRDITRKLSEQPELFLVGELDGRVMATAMAGYDGHRGWIYYLAVAPGYRKAAYGRQMMREVEHLLGERGCSKLNLQVRAGNTDVLAFYHALGYVEDEVVSLGRRLISD